MADRGSYKIFLGMAAGVGKTYRMLQEGQAEADSGRDVVGLVETHGRADTAALVDRLDVIARRRVEHRGVALEEMDLLAILKRAPEFVLIDELAWRSSQRLAAELDILVVRDPGREPTAAEREQLEVLRRLASMLGSQLIVEHGDDVADLAGGERSGEVEAVATVGVDVGVSSA